MTQPGPPPPFQPGPQWSTQGEVPPQSQPRKPRRWPWVVGIVAALLVGIGIGSGSSGSGSSTASTAGTTKTVQAPASTVTVAAGAPAEAPTPAAPAPAADGPKTSFSAGTYEVGTDIQPGKYKTPGPEGGSGICYWARLKDTSGGPSAIIANGVPQGPSTVTIARTDAAFETSGCTWTKAG